MLLSILLQATSAADSLANNAGDSAKEPESFLSLAFSGSALLVMIPIGIMLIVTVYLAIERWLTIQNATKIDPTFMMNIKDMVLNDNIMGADSLCKRTDSPIARMIEKGVSRIGKPITDIESAIENVGVMEVYKLEKNLGFLSTIAGLAPMFGFLGTIIGVIQMFQKIAETKAIEIGTISGGLYVGMISSASYHLLMLKIDRVANKMEANKLEFLDILQQPA